jgi:hypothetical protein
MKPFGRRKKGMNGTLTDDEFRRLRHKKGTLTAVPPSVSELLAKPVSKTELFARVNWQLEL